jgi:hypothetical protein
MQAASFGLRATHPDRRQVWSRQELISTGLYSLQDQSDERSLDQQHLSGNELDGIVEAFYLAVENVPSIWTNNA